LVEVYGAITYYLDRQVQIDSYLRQIDYEFDSLRDQARLANSDLYKKLADAEKNEKVSQILDR
jgi:hypothetical protein